MDANSHVTTLLAKDLVLRSLGEVEQLNIGTVHFTGGEPFLYPYLQDLLHSVSGQESYGVTIATNGTLIDRDAIILISDCGATLHVSIDGPPAYHDEFRGVKGAFQKTERNIGLMVDAEIPVTIVTTICQDNLVHLPWLAEWASELGIRNVVIQPLLELGRAVRIKDRKLSQDQIYDLFFQLSDLGSSYRSKGLEFGITYKSRDLLVEHPCAAYVCDGIKCHRKAAKEIKKLIIREDGTILPEIPTLNPRFSLGDIREGLLVDLVKRYFESNYSEFDRLCRVTYAEVIPAWESPFIPWDEIVSERSWKGISI